MVHQDFQTLRMDIYTPEYSQSLMLLNVDGEQAEYIAGMFPKGKLSALVADAGTGKGWVLVASLALKYNVAIVFTQVINKNEIVGGRLTTKSVRGFSGIYQWVEVMWALDNPDKDITIKRLYQIKNNVDQKDPNDYVFKLDNSTIIWLNTNDLKFTGKTSNKLNKRKEILLANNDKSGIDIAKLIQEQEPFTKLNTLIQWVSKERNR